MRVLITTDAVGGVWTFTQELTAGLLTGGCPVVLACVGRGPSAAQMRSVEQMKSCFPDGFDFTWIDAPLEWEQENESALTGVADHLLRLAEEFGAELMHSSQYCFGALSDTLPVVVTAHSDVLSWAESCRTAPLEDSAWLRRYKMLVSAGLRGANAVTAPTRWMLGALGAAFELPAEQVVIANGRTLPQPAGGSQRRLQASSAGRLWDEAKHVALLAEVVSPMPILVAGECGYQAAEAGTSFGAAKLLGPLAELDLLALFSESAVYVCTSRYEPFGLAPLEAALCGCAVLAQDIAPLREVWGDAALYFSDAKGLSALLHQLAENEELLHATQAGCAERAKRYTREAMTAGYLALYRRVTRRAETCRAA